MIRFFRFFALLIGLGFALIAATLTPMGALAQSTSGIISPASGSSVSGDVIIQGTAVIEPFQKYELHFKREPSPDDAYSYFDGGTTPIVNGPLGIWRTGGLAPGIYSLRLRVVKLDGNYSEFPALNINVNQQAAALESPTSEVSPTSSTPTETPIPTLTFTPGPTPTPNIGSVEQPVTLSEALIPTNTPEPLSVAVAPQADAAAGNGSVVNSANTGTNGAQAAEVTSSATRALGEAFSMDRLRSEFWRGVRISALVCLLGLVLVMGRQAFAWSRRRIQ